MEIKIEIKSIIGKVIFSYIKENNTMRDTVEQANLSGADLRGANLYNADLSGADLRGANLRGANLRGANLYNADLSGANLCYAYLRGANLYNADLRGADLRGANLRGANLYNADLSGAYLRGAILYNADLSGANLRGADMGDWGKLADCSDILNIYPIGSRNGCTTIFHTDKGVFVKCGCFRGTLDEFAKKVKDTHGDNKHARDYLALVDFVLTKYNV